MRNLQLSHNNSRMLSLPSQADTAHHWLPSPVFDKECAMDRTLKPQPASSTPLECPLYLRAYATLSNWPAWTVASWPIPASAKRSGRPNWQNPFGVSPSSATIGSQEGLFSLNPSDPGVHPCQSSACLA